MDGRVSQTSEKASGWFCCWSPCSLHHTARQAFGKLRGFAGRNREMPCLCGLTSGEGARLSLHAPRGGMVVISSPVCTSFLIIFLCKMRTIIACTAQVACELAEVQGTYLGELLPHNQHTVSARILLLLLLLMLWKVYYFSTVIKVREPQVRSHKFHCQNHVLWTVLLHLCYLNKIFFLG